MQQREVKARTLFDDRAAVWGPPPGCLGEPCFDGAKTTWKKCEASSSFEGEAKGRFRPSQGRQAGGHDSNSVRGRETGAAVFDDRPRAHLVSLACLSRRRLRGSDTHGNGSRAAAL